MDEGQLPNEADISDIIYHGTKVAMRQAAEWP
jgi:hypothetical protein